MEFIKREEIIHLIPENILNDLTEENDISLEYLEKVAISEIDSYIGAKYNTSNLFNLKDNDRSFYFIQVVIDIMLWHLHSRLTPNQIPVIRTDRYNKVIAYLYEVSKGKITPNIPLNSLPNDIRSNENLFGYSPKTNDVTY